MKLLREKMLFSEGLNFGIYPLYLNLIDVQKEFENFYQEIRSILDHSQPTEFKRILLNLHSKYKSSCFHLRKHDVPGFSKEKFALDSLRKDKSIIVSKPDKRQGVTILNKCDYITKM